MITTRPLFFILIAISIVIFVYLISDHIINYDTWGSNGEYFVKDYHGYDVSCEINYFAEPTNCKIVDDNEIQVPNETLMDILPYNECYMFENDNILPCRMD